MTTKEEKNPFKYVSEGEVREIVELMLGEAFREHSRQLEEHLRSLHQRLQEIETTRR